MEKRHAQNMCSRCKQAGRQEAKKWGALSSNLEGGACCLLHQALTFMTPIRCFNEEEETVPFVLRALEAAVYAWAGEVQVT